MAAPTFRDFLEKTIEKSRKLSEIEDLAKLVDAQFNKMDEATQDAHEEFMETLTVAVTDPDNAFALTIDVLKNALQAEKENNPTAQEVLELYEARKLERKQQYKPPALREGVGGQIQYTTLATGDEKPRPNIDHIIKRLRAVSSWTGIRPGNPYRIPASKVAELTGKNYQEEFIYYAAAAVEEPLVPRPVGWGNIVGLDTLRQRLTLSLILPQTSPDLFRGDAPLSVNRNFVLWGPPGTGKTVIARRAAQIAGAYFMPLKGFQLLAGYTSDPGPRLDAIYGVAASLGKPVVVFVDEAENVIRDRTKLGSSGGLGQMTQACVQAFLTNIEEGQLDAPVYTIFATNDASEIDPAIMSRVGDSGTIPVWLPSESDRRARLTTELSKMKNIVDRKLLTADNQLDSAFVDDLVRLTQWSSNRDITKALQQIYAMPLARKMKAIGEGDPFSVHLRSLKDLPSVTQEDFMSVLSKAPPSSKTTAIELYTWGAKTYGRPFMADFVPKEYRVTSGK